MCLGLEPGTAKLQVQTNPLSYSAPWKLKFFSKNVKYYLLNSECNDQFVVAVVTSQKVDADTVVEDADAVVEDVAVVDDDDDDDVPESPWTETCCCRR